VFVVCECVVCARCVFCVYVECVVRMCVAGDKADGDDAADGGGSYSNVLAMVVATWAGMVRTMATFRETNFAPTLTTMLILTTTR